ncbi:MAG: ABC transporter substrate-binding protein [Candidatus Hermodarchaeota archaeon]
MDKKDLTIILLAILIGASGIANIILSIEVGTIGPVEQNKVVIAASYPGLAKNDPVDTWDQVSMWHQQQVTEGLVYYDISKHPNYAPSPRLAESWVWNNQTSITFKIREGVVFHDGTPLTASAVKWNFERLMWFSNESGLVPANDTSKTGYSASLYYLSNDTYLFDSFIADDVNMEFTIILNVPFGPLLDLLCFISTNIISPASHKFYEIVQRDEILVGTGPYKMESYSFLKNIKYSRNKRWWGKAQYFDQIIMKFVDDDIERMNVGLAGKYDYVSGVLKSYVDQFRNTSGMHVEEIGEDLRYYYFEIYCGPRDYAGNMIVPGDYQYQRNDATFRRALTYALNYTYIIKEIQQGKACYGVPAVPRLMPGHNNSIWHGYNESLTNGYSSSVKKARELMKTIWPAAATWDSDYPGTSENQWTSNTFRTIDLYEPYSFFGDGLFGDLSYICHSSWDLIGVYLDVYDPYWYNYLDITELTPWKVDLFFVNWGPDYLNPYNMIDPLFNLASGSCFSRINDTGLTAMMEDAVSTINYKQQLEKWANIQSYIFDIKRSENPSSHCHIPLYTYKAHQVHKTDLKGVNYNVFNILDTWNWYHEE